MKRLILIIAILPAMAACAPTLRCRVVAISGDKVQRGKWQNGAAGCQAAIRDAKTASVMFGEVVQYKLQMQSAGKDAFIRIEQQPETPALPEPPQVQAQ